MLSSLPGRPLTLSEVRALDESDPLQSCRPLVAFDTGDPLEEVIAVALVTATEQQLLGYDAESNGGWMVISTLPKNASMAELDRISDAVLEWATATYDASEIRIISRGEGDDPLETILPAHPLGKADMPTLETLAGIDAVHPMFCRAESHEIIALLTFQADPGNPEGLMLANYGFDPKTEKWQCIERAAVGDDRGVEDPTDLDIHTWIETHYEDEEILAIAPEPLDT